MVQEDTVDLYCDGYFIQKPFRYAYSKILPIGSFDFNRKMYVQFTGFLRNVIDRISSDIYYCEQGQSLCDGLATLQNHADYTEFVECLDAKKRMNVYIDHTHEPVFDWIAMQDEDEPVSDEDEKVDSNLGHFDDYDHEEDEEVISVRGVVTDKFLDILCLSEDEDTAEDTTETPIYPVHNVELEWDKMIPVLGMKFVDAEELKNLITNYAVNYGYDLWYERNESNRILVKCCRNKEPTCPFRLWASWMKEERTFQIKSLHENHNCNRVFRLSIVNYKWIRKQFVNNILHKPKLSVKKMKAQVSSKFNIIVSTGQCRNAKRYALTLIDGSLKDHYAKLWDYASELRRANPGLTVRMDLDPQPNGTALFFKFYVCLKGVRDGYVEGCRRVIGIDGCYLKGSCKGELLAATARDANNHIYPLAWVVVNVESKQTWTWFLDLLMDDIDGGTSHGITLTPFNADIQQ